MFLSLSIQEQEMQMISSAAEILICLFFLYYIVSKVSLRRTPKKNKKLCNLIDDVNKRKKIIINPYDSSSSGKRTPLRS